MKRKIVILIILLFCFVLCSCSNNNNEENSDVKLSNDSSGFVLLTDVVPDAILEIRYY